MTILNVSFLKKLCPKSSPTLPTAKRNHRGKIIYSPKGVKQLLANEYKNCLRRHRIIQGICVSRNQYKSLKSAMSRALG